MIRKLLATALLMSPLAAQADPISITVFLIEAGVSSAIATAIASAVSWVAANAFYVTVVALNVFGAANARRKAKAEIARQRRQANAALTDRAITALSTTPPWRIVYGEAIVGGDIVAVFTSDKQTYDERGKAFTKKDAYKHIVVHIASHSCESIDDVVIEGVRLGQLDEDGWVKNTAKGTGRNYVFASAYPVGTTVIELAAGEGTILVDDEIVLAGDSNRYRVVSGLTAPGPIVIAAPGLQQAVSSGTPVYLGNEFSVLKKFPRMGVINPTATLTVPDGTVGDTIDAFYTVGDSYSSVAVTVSPDKKQITNPSGYMVTVNYEVVVNQSMVRVLKHLGDPNQVVDPVLSAMFPVEWDSSHRLRGKTYAILTLDLEEPRFQGGPPSMSFVVRGKNDIYDPRTGLSVYTNNNALVIGDWLCAPWGFDCDRTQDINLPQWIECANDCDVPTTFETLMPNGSIATEVGPRFTCNGSFTTDSDKEAVLDSLADSMGGNVVYGAQWSMFAGVWKPPVVFDDGSTALTDDDLMGPIEFPQAAAGIEDLINGIRGTFIERGKLSATDFDPYQNPTFRAEDGEDFFDDVTMPWTNTKPRCKNLARILVEKNRDSQIMTVPAKLKAFKLQVGDRFNLISEEYGINKTVRVTDWQFDIANAVSLTVQEDFAEIYDEADAARSDPYPNTSLPNPFQVNELKNLVATSGVSTMEVRADGVMIPRVLLTWDPVDSPYVTDGQGYIVFRWRSALSAEATWSYVRAQGDDTSAYLTGVQHNTPILIEATVYNSLGRPSVSVIRSHVVIGDPNPPETVDGFSVGEGPGGLTFRWRPAASRSVAGTQIQQGTAWVAGGVPRWSGNALEWYLPWPEDGEYTFLARHFNYSGVLSEDIAGVNFAVLNQRIVSISRTWLMSTGEPALWIASIFDPENGEIIGSEPASWLGSGGTLLIDTPQLEDESVNFVVQSDVTSGSYSTGAISGVGLLTSTLGPISLTNPLSVPLKFEVSFSCSKDLLTPSDFSFSYFEVRSGVHLYDSEDMLTPVSSSGRAFKLRTAVANQTYSWDESLSFTVEVPVGKTYVVVPTLDIAYTFGTSSSVTVQTQTQSLYAIALKK